MMRAHVGRAAAAIAAAAAFVATVACSGSNASGGSNVSASQACSDLASAICSKLQSCAPFLVQLEYGSVSTCEQVTQGPCTEALGANGVTASTSEVESCAQGYTGASCSDLESNNTPSACQVHGSLAAGTACGSAIQCSGDSYCNIGTNSTCGVCAALVAAGGSCQAESDCEKGLVCHTATGATAGTCVAPVAQGASCTAGGTPCAFPDVCTGGTCQAAGGAGAQCDPAAGNCDITQGLYCGQNSVCTKATIVSAGQACGLVNGTYALCGSGSTCTLSGTTGMGTCAAAAANGASCGANGAGAACMPGAACVNGVCTVANPASCH
jgi:hypothetical protein